MKWKLFCLAAFLTLTACTGSVPKEESPDIQTVVTNVYDPVACPLPAGYSMAESVTPFYDKYTGQITVLGNCEIEVTGEDGEIRRRNVTGLFTFDSDGNLLQSMPLSLPEYASPKVGCIRETDILFVQYRQERWSLVTCLREDGSVQSETEIPPEQLPFIDDRILFMQMDREGKLWLGNHHTVLRMREDLTLHKQFALPGLVNGLVCGEDGSMYACVHEGTSLLRLEAETGTYTEVTAWDREATTLAFAGYTAGEDAGYDFYYSTPDGIYGAWMDGTESEMVLDSAASGIINYGEARLMGGNRGGTELVSVCSEDLMLFAETVSRDGQWITTPVLYRTAEDIVLAEVQVIEFAHAIPLEDNIRANLINYDTKNRDVSVVTLDYSKYNTNDDPEAGAWRLVTDILNGMISPDIVYGYSDSTEILQMLEHGRYTDLMPYFMEDDTVNPDTVFGCVQKAFTDEDGKLWALTPYFMLDTLLATTESLGECAGQSTWTVEEFLDFADRYDTLMFDLTREYAQSRFYAVYEAFCDTGSGTCTFDSPLFKRYLEFLLSLPAEAEYETKSPLAQVANTDRYKYYMDGSVPLKDFYMGAPLQMRYEMGTPDVTLIGFPTNGASGANLFTRMTFLMTDTAEDPGLCWEFIKAFMHTEYGMWMSGPGTTSMKEVFTALAYENQGKMYRVYGNGNAYEDSEAAFIDSIGLSDALGGGTSYTLEEWHEPTVQYGIAYLDTEGVPLCDRLPNAVSEIIEEEFSALAAGQGTAADCADKIQSRVSIWLAENAD